MIDIVEHWPILAICAFFVLFVTFIVYVLNDAKNRDHKKRIVRLEENVKTWSEKYNAAIGEMGVIREKLKELLKDEKPRL
jgi:hypothetical protein